MDARIPEGEGEQIGTRRNNVSVPADDDEIHLP